MEDKKIRVAITHGDTNGIGYEVILKAFEDPTMLEFCTPIIYGSSKVASYHRKAMELETQYNVISKAEDAHPNRVNLLSTFDEEVKVEFGQPTAESAEAARKAMARAKEDLQKGLFDVLVTAPVQSAPNPTREDKALTVMCSDKVRIGLVTTHLPIKEVSQAITVEKIVDKGTIFHPSIPSLERKKNKSSNPLSRHWKRMASRPSVPMWQMSSLARICTMTSTVCWRCTTIRVSCLSRHSHRNTV